MTDTEPPKLPPEEKGWYEEHIEGAASDLNKKIAEGIEKATDGKIKQRESRKYIPWVGALAVGGLGLAFAEPLGRLGGKMMKGLRWVVTGGGHLEKIPLIGGVFSLLGKAVDTVGDVSGYIFAGVASLLTFSALKGDVNPTIGSMQEDPLTGPRGSGRLYRTKLQEARDDLEKERKGRERAERKLKELEDKLEKEKKRATEAEKALEEKKSELEDVKRKLQETERLLAEKTRALDKAKNNLAKANAALDKAERAAKDAREAADRANRRATAAEEAARETERRAKEEAARLKRESEDARREFEKRAQEAKDKAAASDAERLEAERKAAEAQKKADRLEREAADAKQKADVAEQKRIAAEADTAKVKAQLEKAEQLAREAASKAQDAQQRAIEAEKAASEMRKAAEETQKQAKEAAEKAEKLAKDARAEAETRQKELKDLAAESDARIKAEAERLLKEAKARAKALEGEAKEAKAAQAAADRKLLEANGRADAAQRSLNEANERIRQTEEKLKQAEQKLKASEERGTRIKVNKQIITMGKVWVLSEDGRWFIDEKGGSKAGEESRLSDLKEVKDSALRDKLFDELPDSKVPKSSKLKADVAKAAAWLADGTGSTDGAKPTPEQMDAAKHLGQAELDAAKEAYRDYLSKGGNDPKFLADKLTELGKEKAEIEKAKAEGPTSRGGAEAPPTTTPEEKPIDLKPAPEDGKGGESKPAPKDGEVVVELKKAPEEAKAVPTNADVLAAQEKAARLLKEAQEARKRATELEAKRNGLEKELIDQRAKLDEALQKAKTAHEQAKILAEKLERVAKLTGELQAAAQNAHQDAVAKQAEVTLELEKAKIAAKEKADAQKKLPADADDAAKQKARQEVEDANRKVKEMERKLAEAETESKRAQEKRKAAERKTSQADGEKKAAAQKVMDAQRRIQGIEKKIQVIDNKSTKVKPVDMVIRYGNLYVRTEDGKWYTDTKVDSSPGTERTLEGLEEVRDPKLKDKLHDAVGEDARSRGKEAAPSSSELAKAVAEAHAWLKDGTGAKGAQPSEAQKEAAKHIGPEELEKAKEAYRQHRAKGLNDPAFLAEELTRQGEAKAKQSGGTGSSEGTPPPATEAKAPTTPQTEAELEAELEKAKREAGEAAKKHTADDKTAREAKSGVDASYDHTSGKLNGATSEATNASRTAAKLESSAADAKMEVQVLEVDAAAGKQGAGDSGSTPATPDTKGDAPGKSGTPETGSSEGKGGAPTVEAAPITLEPAPTEAAKAGKGFLGGVKKLATRRLPGSGFASGVGEAGAGLLMDGMFIFSGYQTLNKVNKSEMDYVVGGGSIAAGSAGLYSRGVGTVQGIRSAYYFAKNPAAAAALRSGNIANMSEEAARMSRLGGSARFAGRVAGGGAGVITIYHGGEEIYKNIEGGTHDQWKYAKGVLEIGLGMAMTYSVTGLAGSGAAGTVAGPVGIPILIAIGVFDGHYEKANSICENEGEKNLQDYCNIRPGIKPNYFRVANQQSTAKGSDAVMASSINYPNLHFVRGLIQTKARDKDKQKYILDYDGQMGTLPEESPEAIKAKLDWYQKELEAEVKATLLKLANGDAKKIPGILARLNDPRKRSMEQGSVLSPFGELGRWKLENEWEVKNDILNLNGLADKLEKVKAARIELGLDSPKTHPSAYDLNVAKSGRFSDRNRLTSDEKRLSLTGHVFSESQQPQDKYELKKEKNETFYVPRKPVVTVKAHVPKGVSQEEMFELYFKRDNSYTMNGLESFFDSVSNYPISSKLMNTRLFLIPGAPTWRDMGYKDWAAMDDPNYSFSFARPGQHVKPSERIPPFYDPTTDEIVQVTVFTNSAPDVPEHMRTLKLETRIKYNPVKAKVKLPDGKEVIEDVKVPTYATAFNRARLERAKGIATAERLGELPKGWEDEKDPLAAPVLDINARMLAMANSFLLHNTAVDSDGAPLAGKIQGEDKRIEGAEIIPKARMLAKQQLPAKIRVVRNGMEVEEPLSLAPATNDGFKPRWQPDEGLYGWGYTGNPEFDRYLVASASYNNAVLSSELSGDTPEMRKKMLKLRERELVAAFDALKTQSQDPALEEDRKHYADFKKMLEEKTDKFNAVFANEPFWKEYISARESYERVKAQADLMGNTRVSEWMTAAAEKQLYATMAGFQPSVLKAKSSGIEREREFFEENLKFLLLNEDKLNAMYKDEAFWKDFQKAKAEFNKANEQAKALKDEPMAEQLAAIAGKRMMESMPAFDPEARKIIQQKSKAELTEKYETRYQLYNMGKPMVQNKPSLDYSGKPYAPHILASFHYTDARVDGKSSFRIYDLFNREQVKSQPPEKRRALIEEEVLKETKANTKVSFSILRHNPGWRLRDAKAYTRAERLNIVKQHLMYTKPEFKVPDTRDEEAILEFRAKLNKEAERLMLDAAEMERIEKEIRASEFVTFLSQNGMNIEDRRIDELFSKYMSMTDANAAEVEALAAAEMARLQVNAMLGEDGEELLNLGIMPAPLADAIRFYAPKDKAAVQAQLNLQMPPLEGRDLLTNDAIAINAIIKDKLADKYFAMHGAKAPEILAILPDTKDALSWGTPTDEKSVPRLRIRYRENGEVKEKSVPYYSDRTKPDHLMHTLLAAFDPDAALKAQLASKGLEDIKIVTGTSIEDSKPFTQLMNDGQGDKQVSGYIEMMFSPTAAVLEMQKDTSKITAEVWREFSDYAHKEAIDVGLKRNKDGVLIMDDANLKLFKSNAGGAFALEYGEKLAPMYGMGAGGAKFRVYGDFVEENGQHYFKASGKVERQLRNGGKMGEWEECKTMALADIDYFKLETPAIAEYMQKQMDNPLNPALGMFGKSRNGKFFISDTPAVKDAKGVHVPGGLMDRSGNLSADGLIELVQSRSAEHLSKSRFTDWKDRKGLDEFQKRELGHIQAIPGRGFSIDGDTIILKANFSVTPAHGSGETAYMAIVAKEVKAGTEVTVTIDGETRQVKLGIPDKAKPDYKFDADEYVQMLAEDKWQAAALREFAKKGEVTTIATRTLDGRNPTITQLKGKGYTEAKLREAVTGNPAANLRLSLTPEFEMEMDKDWGISVNAANVKIPEYAELPGRVMTKKEHFEGRDAIAHLLIGVKKLEGENFGIRRAQQVPVPGVGNGGMGGAGGGMPAQPMNPQSDQNPALQHRYNDSFIHHSQGTIKVSAERKQEPKENYVPGMMSTWHINLVDDKGIQVPAELNKRQIEVRGREVDSLDPRFGGRKVLQIMEIKVPGSKDGSGDKEHWIPVNYTFNLEDKSGFRGIERERLLGFQFSDFVMGLAEQNGIRMKDERGTAADKSGGNQPGGGDAKSGAADKGGATDENRSAEGPLILAPEMHQLKIHKGSVTKDTKIVPGSVLVSAGNGKFMVLPPTGMAETEATLQRRIEKAMSKLPLDVTKAEGLLPIIDMKTNQSLSLPIGGAMRVNVADTVKFGTPGVSEEGDIRLSAQVIELPKRKQPEIPLIRANPRAVIVPKFVPGQDQGFEVQPGGGFMPAQLPVVPAPNLQPGAGGVAMPAGQNGFVPVNNQPKGFVAINTPKVFGIIFNMPPGAQIQGFTAWQGAPPAGLLPPGMPQLPPGATLGYVDVAAPPIPGFNALNNVPPVQFGNLPANVQPPKDFVPVQGAIPLDEPALPGTTNAKADSQNKDVVANAFEQFAKVVSGAKLNNVSIGGTMANLPAVKSGSQNKPTDLA